MQIMYLQVKLIFYWAWHDTEFPCFTFQYSQCDVMLMFCYFKLYYINIIMLIIRVICLRLRNAICGSNFSEKMCMDWKKWFPEFGRYKTFLWICYLEMFRMVLTKTVLWTYQTGSLFVYIVIKCSFARISYFILWLLGSGNCSKEVNKLVKCILAQISQKDMSLNLELHWGQLCWVIAFAIPCRWSSNAFVCVCVCVCVCVYVCSGVGE